MTPRLHSIGYAGSGKEDMHGSFRVIILWNNISRLVLKVTESERIDAHAGPLTIVAFLAAVTTVISREMLGASAQHALAQWGIIVWTAVPSSKYVVKEPKKGHDNESD